MRPATVAPVALGFSLGDVTMKKRRKTRSCGQGLPLVCAAAVLSVATACVKQSELERTLDPQAVNAQTRWVRGFSDAGSAQNLILANGDVTTFLRSDRNLPELGGELAAFPLAQGEETWSTPVPFVRSAVVLLLADETSVYAITVTGADAYDASTGTLLWSSTLGVGHVEVDGQLEGAVVRVYYGETVFEIDKKTGSVVASYPKGSLLWQVGSLQIIRDPESGIVGTEMDSGEVRWSSGLERFRMDDPWTPQLVGTDTLVVHPLSATMGYCALRLQDGSVAWCTNDRPVSNFSAVEEQGYGYYLRNDFRLIRVDLSSGQADLEVPFLPSTLPSSMSGYRYEYWVAADGGSVAVLFSDSNQLFVLDVSD
jgi:outer membrane protein assembly factor BamB